MKASQSITFSKRLENWSRSKQPKTIANLNAVFGEKSFAVLLLILLAVPALPIPTGGLTHIFEIIALLIALEMIIGRVTVWLPRSWSQKTVGDTLEKKGIPFLVNKIRWLEKFTRPRLSGLLTHRATGSILGIIMFLLTLTALLAPPFTGLDTLPALGVVLISLSIILEDILVLILGLILGASGIGLVILGGDIVVRFFHHLF